MVRAHVSVENRTKHGYPAFSGRILRVGCGESGTSGQRRLQKRFLPGSQTVGRRRDLNGVDATRNLIPGLHLADYSHHICYPSSDPPHRNPPPSIPCPVSRTLRSESVSAPLSKISKMLTVTDGTVQKFMPSSVYPTPPLPLSTALSLPPLKPPPNLPGPRRNSMRERDKEYGDRFVPNRDSGDMRTSYHLKDEGGPSTPSKSRLIPTESDALKGTSPPP
jgi:hypothetical protein